MSLKSALGENLKISLKSADRFRVGILRLILAALHYEEIAKRGKRAESELSAEEETAVLKREAKKRKEAIEIYAKAGRDDLREQEEKELAVINEYLPEEMSREAVREIVEKIAKNMPADFSSVMREAMRELKGRADGKMTAEIVKEVLGQ